MITRAKDKMVVIKSFKSEDITNINNENSNIFKGFLSYVEQIQETGASGEQTNTTNIVVSPIIDNLYNQFKANSG
jgi:hypothetical protein